MIVLSGASASGKTEAARALGIKYNITRSITTTTRASRAHEVNGRDYFFVDIPTFKQMIKDEKFVEYTEYNGNFYGSTKDQISNDKCIVIDSSGLKSYSEIKDRNVVTFLLVAKENTRRNRMIERGDNIEDIEKRLFQDATIYKLENLVKPDFIIDTDKYNIEEVTDLILSLYKSKIK